MLSATRPRHVGRTPAAVAAIVVSAVCASLVPAGASASAEAETLPLGDPDLAEARTVHSLAPGVTLTRIVRGSEPAPPDEIDTTTRGPWRVHVLSIDPDKARGQLQATYGPDLARVEKTTELVRFAGALAGVNASFFTFTANRQYPGDPVGLGLFGGQLLSEPAVSRDEVDLVVNARSSRVLMGHLTWSGVVRNRKTEERLPLEFLNHPPVVPAGCADLVDQTRCTHPGDLVHFPPEFAASTPSGAGVEVVLDRVGCVVRTATVRGTALAAGQTSLQATGRDSAALLDLTDEGCLDRNLTVVDETGETLALRPGLFGVNGRYRLTADDEVVVPDGSGGFFGRNPRTIAGTTREGTIVLATIDGRQTTSVAPPWTRRRR
ncbi:MAG: phosphodiester glycosidase family protein [Nocardioidaceae bacterium]